MNIPFSRSVLIGTVIGAIRVSFIIAAALTIWLG